MKGKNNKRNREWPKGCMKSRRDALKKGADADIAKLSKLHMITCPDELNKTLSDIDHSDMC